MGRASQAVLQARYAEHGADLQLLVETDELADAMLRLAKRINGTQLGEL